MNNLPIFPYHLMAPQPNNIMAPHPPQQQEAIPVQPIPDNDENKENDAGVPHGFVPHPFFLIKNAFPPPFFPPAPLANPLYNPAFPHMLNAESLDESNAEGGSFDQLHIQRLLAANALLHLKNNDLNNSLQPSTSDEENELVVPPTAPTLGEEEIEDDAVPIADSPHDASSPIGEQSGSSPMSPPQHQPSTSGMPQPSTSAMPQLPAQPAEQSGSFLQVPAALQQLASVINAVTPKSKKSGTSSLLKSEVPGFNKTRGRASKRVTPANEKDSKYYERRIRNNISAKRSRDLRKSIEGCNSIKIAKYESENNVLRAQREKYIEEKEYLVKMLAEAKAKSESEENKQSPPESSCLNQTGDVNEMEVNLRSD